MKTPIVAVMGHVDHGKTSLLDKIRGARVADKEHGGITQNTRAHHVKTKSGFEVTFIDTPGHEAFSAMRERGAEVTDFVLLVVAANDGVQPQTIESIKFALGSETPIIVALNKMDMQGIKPDKIKQELSSHGVIIEQYGGDALLFEVSAQTGDGIDALLEGIELSTEIRELKKSEPRDNSEAEAYVIESILDKRVGAKALTLVKAGTVKTKQFAASLSGVFKVRALFNEYEKGITVAEDSDPVWISGLDSTLPTGEQLFFFNSEKEANEYNEKLNVESAEFEVDETEDAEDFEDAKQILINLVRERQAKKEGVEQKVLDLIVKASTEGTLEAVLYELEKLGDEEARLNILSTGTGEVTEDDISRAKSANALVVGFQVPVNNRVIRFAKNEKVIVKNYEIIYQMVDEIELVMNGLITDQKEEVVISRALVKKIFTLSDNSIVAGCIVNKGNMLRGYNVYIDRIGQSTDEEIAEVGRGKIKELRLVKNVVKEVKKGQECGIMIDPAPAGMQEGDEIVAYKLE